MYSVGIDQFYTELNKAARTIDRLNALNWRCFRIGAERRRMNGDAFTYCCKTANLWTGLKSEEGTEGAFSHLTLSNWFIVHMKQYWFVRRYILLIVSLKAKEHKWKILTFVFAVTMWPSGSLRNLPPKAFLWWKSNLCYGVPTHPEVHFYLTIVRCKVKSPEVNRFSGGVKLLFKV